MIPLIEVWSQRGLSVEGREETGRRKEGSRRVKEEKKENKQFTNTWVKFRNVILKSVLISVSKIEVS